MAENIIPMPNESSDWLEDFSSQLCSELLKIQGVYTDQDKELFDSIMRKYDDK